jgi:hypothetical protein
MLFSLPAATAGDQVDHIRVSTGHGRHEPTKTNNSETTGELLSTQLLPK